MRETRNVGEATPRLELQVAAHRVDAREELVEVQADGHLGSRVNASLPSSIQKPTRRG
jgi:hypothetical protein